MFDALPPPAIIEPAPPGYGRTQSGLLIPHKAFGVIPALTPGLWGVGVGDFGRGYVAPQDPPAIVGTVNVSNGLTGATASFTPTPYAVLIAMIGTRSSQLIAHVHSIVDSLGNVWDQLGTTLQANNGSNLWNALSVWRLRGNAGATPAARTVTFTMGAVTNNSIGGYVLEVENPDNLTCDTDAVDSASSNSTSLPLTSSGGTYLLDLVLTNGTVTNPAGSGMNQDFSNALLSGTTRYTGFYSDFQRAAARTYTSSGIACAVQTLRLRFPVARSASRARLTLVDKLNITGTSGTVTWSGASFGPEAEDRLLILCTSIDAASATNNSITSVTIAGRTPFRLVAVASTIAPGAMWFLHLPKGLTGSIVHTGAGISLDRVFYLFTLTGAENAALNMAGNAAAYLGSNSQAPPMALAVQSVPDKASLLAFHCHRINSPTVWSGGATQVTASNIIGTAFAGGQHDCAVNDNNSGAAANVTPTATWTGTAAAHLCAAMFGP